MKSVLQKLVAAISGRWRREHEVVWRGQGARQASESRAVDARTPDELIEMFLVAASDAIPD
jgi:hypothetical protein